MSEGAARDSSLGFRGSRWSRGSMGSKGGECCKINKVLVGDTTEWKIAVTPLFY